MPNAQQAIIDAQYRQLRHPARFQYADRRELAPIVGAVLLAIFLFVGLVVAVASCATLPANKVLDGAKLVLAGLCESVPSAQLDLAREKLEANKVKEAAQHLRDELVAHGDQPDVKALLALIQTQIPPDAIESTPPVSQPPPEVIP